MSKDETICWIWGKRLSVRRGLIKYWVQYGNVKSNKTWKRVTARRQACRIKSRISEKPIAVLSLRFREDERFYSIGFYDLEVAESWD